VTGASADIVDQPEVGLREGLQARSLAGAGREGTAALARRVVYGATATYAVVFSTAVALYYYSFQEQRLDLGDMVQAIWSTAHGHVLQMTTPTGEEMSRLGAHADVFLLLLAPLWWIVASPLALLIVQVLAVASGALPTYWLARKHLGSERAGAHLAIGYLLFPATQFNAFTPAAGFHPVSFALPLLMYAIWFLDEKRLIPFTLFALLAASTKEEIPAALGCLGIWYAFRKGERVAGATIAALGFGLSAIEFLVVIPHFSIAGFSPFAVRYSSVGGTPRGIVHMAVTHPGVLLHAVFTPHKLLYLGLLFIPFLGLFLREPLLALAAVPDLAINLLSAVTNQTSLDFQYNAGIVPFLLAASIIGMRKLKRDPDRLSFYALAGVAVLSVYSPLLTLGTSVRAFSADSGLRKAQAHALQVVPAGAPVAASNELAGYLSARRYITVFPYIRHVRWIVVDRSDQTTVSDQASYLRAIKQIDSRPGWKMVYSSHGVQVLRKSAGGGEGR
jgi:uncharacterized membrane protein